MSEPFPCLFFTPSLRQVHARTHTHAFSPSLPLAPILSHSFSLSLALSPPLSPTLSLPPSHPPLYTLSPSFPLFRSHSHTHAHLQMDFCINALALTQCIGLAMFTTTVAKKMAGLYVCVCVCVCVCTATSTVFSMPLLKFSPFCILFFLCLGFRLLKNSLYMYIYNMLGFRLLEIYRIYNYIILLYMYIYIYIYIYIYVYCIFRV